MSPHTVHRFTKARGGFRVHLSPEEQALLRSLPDQLNDLLTRIESGDEETAPISRRLFPPAHPNDEVAERVYVDAHRTELIEHHRMTAAMFENTVHETHLTEEQLENWLTAMNDLRIVLGSSLGVTEESLPVEDDDPNYAEWICYHYLSFLVDEIVDALSSGLPPVSDDDDQTLPEDPWGDPPGGLRWDGTERPNFPDQKA